MTTNLLIANGGAPLVASHDTYMAGFLAKPIDPLTLYYSFSTNAAGVTFNSQPLFRTGKQHEFGLKTDIIKQRLTFTAAHYEIIQTNLSTANPAFNVDPINNPQNILSDQTNHGFEFELKGGITQELSVVASYTTQRLRDSFNRRPRNIADRTAGALINYRFSHGTFKNLSAFVGMTRQGKSAGETPASSATPLGVIEQVGFYVPGFTQYNVGANYAWHAYAFGLTVDNLFDHRGFWQAAGRGAVPPIPGRNIRFTSTVKF
jgi:iron complex outermembrane receptor protein